MFNHLAVLTMVGGIAASIYGTLVWVSHQTKAKPSPIASAEPISCRAVKTAEGLVGVVIGEGVK